MCGDTRVIGYWSLGRCWSLGFGAWSFLHRVKDRRGRPSIRLSRAGYRFRARVGDLVEADVDPLLPRVAPAELVIDAAKVLELLLRPHFDELGARADRLAPPDLGTILGAQDDLRLAHVHPA